jgi:hypothetical protein
MILGCINAEADWDEESVSSVTEVLKESLLSFRGKQLDRKEKARRSRELTDKLKAAAKQLGKQSV